MSYFHEIVYFNIEIFDINRYFVLLCGRRRGKIQRNNYAISPEKRYDSNTMDTLPFRAYKCQYVSSVIVLTLTNKYDKIYLK